MADDPRIDSIAGIRFNERGPSISDEQIQATWTRQVDAERARRKPLTQEQDADGLAERRWSQR